MNKHSIIQSALRPLAAALTIAGIVAALSGCGEASSKAQEATPPGAPITAAPAIARQITETQEFSGRMESVENVEIRARVSGYITAVNFQPGGKVSKGQVLFVIDPRPYQAEANRAEAAAHAARARADLARLELARAEKLLADKAIAQREFDERAATQKELEANARAASAQFDTAKLNLSYTQVTAPINGRASKAEITVGNLIDASAVLTSVVSDEKIYASFDGDESTYIRVAANVQQGRAINVRVGLAGEEGYPHEGKLEFIDNKLDVHTGAVRMRAVFVNSDRVLAPGLFAKVQVDTGNAQAGATNAVLINDKAIGTDQSRKFVFVVTADNKAEYRQVTLGQSVDGLRIVRTGLKAGEKVVVNGLQRVRPGAPLAPQIVSMTADHAPAATADVKVAVAGTSSKGH
ncbi:efflux RND transporter periplasmic adaptor subunit [Duganella callida]|uniref:Efflux RND transporter periplasmic adaptor subunit n=1 Tax=Duganella callida TaxID=2561932 RepID=A0A4Y9SAL0_9BURK|nr:efflux RND transporter periplasmic adaptor subunit [Duganella callida]TFW18679.1 efflux RND transporter periplasmic adaptor subunit [Duganella callida]